AETFGEVSAAAVTISGIELAAKIRKHQFKVGKLPGRPKTIPAIWAAVVAAPPESLLHTLSATRSQMVGIPSARSPPPGFGTITLRTACGYTSSLEARPEAFQPSIPAHSGGQVSLKKTP